MTQPYKDLNISELSMERLRLKQILQNHPKPNTYKQTKKSLERIEKLIVDKILEEKQRNEKDN